MYIMSDEQWDGLLRKAKIKILTEQKGYTLEEVKRLKHAELNDAYYADTKPHKTPTLEGREVAAEEKATSAIIEREETPIIEIEERPGKRITIAIIAHGKEIVSQGLTVPSGVDVRVFSKPGQLGIPYLSTSTVNEDMLVNVHADFLKELKRTFPQTLLQFNDSSYRLLKEVLSSDREDYPKLLVRLAKEHANQIAIMEKLYSKRKQESGDTGLLKKTLLHLYEESKLYPLVLNSALKQEHIRTYKPVCNKIYSYPDDTFTIHVIHHDRIDTLKKSYNEIYSGDVDAFNQDIDTLDFTVDSDIIQKLFSEQVRTMLSGLGQIGLQEIVILLTRLGFKIINVVDYSCRDPEEGATLETIQAITRQERETPIVSNYGGGRVKTKRQQKRNKTKRDKTRKSRRRK